MENTCHVCGKKLTKQMRRNAEIIDRFLSVVLTDRKIGSIAMCSKCIDRHENSIPDGWSVQQWRESMAFFAAGCLCRLLKDEEMLEMIEPLIFSQLVFINMMNVVGDKTLNAALKKAQKGQDWIMSIMKE